MEIRGDIVKQLRNERAWTQAHLAELCDVNLRTIQRVENQGSASLETIMALCVSFDIKRQALFKVPEASDVEQAKPQLTKAYLLVFLFGLIIGVAGTFIPFVFLNT
ncbi:helix-turn-helix domain-containing protein [Glaciecola sp. 2405UD65-10]|uniref:helix-turn-helix domain-containing protein n=1 Tax=Glaciecola sp. 2405UD65-10 TaxID=3397244 RepID=UPI003B5AECC6